MAVVLFVLQGFFSPHPAARVNSDEPLWFSIPRHWENMLCCSPWEIQRKSLCATLCVLLETGEDEILLNSDVTRTQEMPLIFYCIL